MHIFLSSQIRDIFQVESVIRWANSLNDPKIGVELLAFTHDDDYWKILCGALKKARCPLTFHGPYIGIEGTSAPSTGLWRFLMESYERVFALAREYGAHHVVYHMTQLAFPVDKLEKARASAEQNLSVILGMAEEAGVKVLVENLPYPRGGAPLYDNEAYGSFFTRHPNVDSLVDLGHVNLNRMNAAEFLRQHGERVKAYHFHNNDGLSDLHRDICSGTFSYTDFVPLYKKYTPQTNIVLEYSTRVNFDDKLLRSHIEYVFSNFT